MSAALSRDEAPFLPQTASLSFGKDLILEVLLILFKILEILFILLSIFFSASSAIGH
jgi:hypothetical protein